MPRKPPAAVAGSIAEREQEVISQEYKTIFVHQRKSGGTAIKDLFPDRVGDLNDGCRDSQWYVDPRVVEYFKFTIVRNPWDRFMSAYHYIGALRRRRLEEVLANLPNRDPWHDFLKGSIRSRIHYSGSHAAVYAYRLKGLLNGQAAWYESRRYHEYNYVHAACPQSELIWTDGDLAVDAVYFLEDMETALQDLRQRIGLQTDAYVVRNRGPVRHDYRESFSPAAQDMFRDVFHRDIELFGYTFDAGPGIAPGSPIYGAGH